MKLYTKMQKVDSVEKMKTIALTRHFGKLRNEVSQKKSSSTRKKGPKK